jgi:hypothetical protein
MFWLGMANKQYVDAFVEFGDGSIGRLYGSVWIPRENLFPRKSCKSICKTFHSN